MNPHLNRPMLGWALAAALCACTSNPPPRAAEAAASPAAAQPGVTAHADGGASAALAQIAELIGDAACDGAGECHTVGIGDKPCGGPAAYLAWSSGVTRPDALAALASRHREARRLQNERSGMRSNCAVTPDPGAVCRPRVSDGKRTCQLGQGGGRSAV